MLVRAPERGRDLDGDAQGLVERQRPAVEPLRQRLALEVLHDEVVDAFLLAHVVQDADVRVAEGGDGARLALEPRAHLRAAAVVGAQHLDRHRAVEARVARLVHLAHAARAETLQDLVGAEPAPRADARERALRRGRLPGGTHEAAPSYRRAAAAAMRCRA